MQSSAAAGMRTMDSAIEQLYDQGTDQRPLRL
jgi:hypothetical protein